MTLLILRRLYTASRGQVPNGRIVRQWCRLKPIELLLYTLSLSTWLSPAFILFSLFFFIEVTLTVPFYLCFQSPFFTEDIVGWAGIPHFQVPYWKVISCLKVFLFIKYFLEYILVCSDTEWLRLKGSSVSSSHWQGPEKACASTTITTTSIWAVANSLVAGTRVPVWHSTPHSAESAPRWDTSLFFLSEPGVVAGAEDSFSLDQLLGFFFTLYFCLFHMMLILERSPSWTSLSFFFWVFCCT